MFDIGKFFGVEPNNIQRRVFVSAIVFGATFVVDIILIVLFGFINKGLKVLSVFTEYHPFSSTRIVMFVLILSVGVFLSLIYYVVLPLGPPPPIREISGKYLDY